MSKSSYHNPQLNGTIRTDQIKLVSNHRSDVMMGSGIASAIGASFGLHNKLSRQPTYNNKTQVHKKLEFTGQNGEGSERGLIDRTDGHEIPTPSSHNFNVATNGGSIFNQSQHYGSFVGSKNTFQTDKELVYVDKKRTGQEATQTDYMIDYSKNIERARLEKYDPKFLDGSYSDRMVY